MEDAGEDDVPRLAMDNTRWQDESDSVASSGIDTFDVCTVATHAVSNANISTIHCDYDIMDDWQYAEAVDDVANELQSSYNPKRSVRASALPTPTQLVFSHSGVYDRVRAPWISQAGSTEEHDSPATRQSVAPATPAAHSSSLSSFSIGHTPAPLPLSVRLPSSGKGLGATDRRGSYDRGCSSKKRSHGQIAWEHLQTVLGDNGFACKHDCQLRATAADTALLTVSHY